MDLKVLEEAGLTQGEIKVYLALLKLGKVSAGPITQESALHRSRVYEALTRLVNKGLVSYTNKAQTKYFQANNPEELLDYLEEKKRNVQTLLPQLKALQAKPEEAYETAVYEGFRGLKSIFENAKRDTPKGGEILVFGARSGHDFHKKTWETYFLNYNRQLESKKIGLRLIYNEDLRGTSEATAHEKGKHNKIRYLKHYTPAGVNIHGDNVAVFVWSKNLAYVMKGKEVADSFR